MHAFEYIILFFSFVYAAAITHILTTVGDLITASRRVIFSWLHAGWLILALLPVLAWWIGIWALRDQKEWDMSTVGLFFFLACMLYLLARLVCPQVPSQGKIDLKTFHLEEGRKYIGGYVIMGILTMIVNTVVGSEANLGDWLGKNLAVLPMTLIAILAAIFIRRPRVQFAAIACELLLWGWYFANRQSALS